MTEPESQPGPELPPNEILAERIANGEPIDWEALRSDPRVDPSELDALQLVERVARSGRAESSTPSGPHFVPPGYLIESFLGRGAYGQVFRARETKLDRVVALKILDPLAGITPTEKARFLREARLLARIDHPNVVRIHAVHEEGDRIALSLEWIDGQTLEQAVTETGPIGVAAAARIVRETCAALTALHTQGIVHCDVKPSNLMHDANGRTVLLDFGVARIAGDGELGALAGSFGTPEFTAPELRDGDGHEDARADVYSLGILLHWLASGELRSGCPSRGGDWAVPEGFRAIVERATVGEPARRFGSAAELATALTPWARGNGTPGATRRIFVHGLVAGVLLGAIAVFSVPSAFDARESRSPTAKSIELPRNGDLHEWLHYDPDSTRAVVVGDIQRPTQLKFADPYDPSVFDDNGTGSRVSDAMSLQDAIDRADEGAVIWVEPNTYRFREPVRIHKKRITIASSGGPLVTVFDGSHLSDSILLVGNPGWNGRELGEPETSVTLAGISWTGGSGHPDELQREPYGGAIWVHSARLEAQHCVFYENGLRDTVFGGAISLIHATESVLKDSLFYANAAWASGGAILASQDSDLEVVRCTIAGNTSRDFYGQQGGIGLHNGSVVTVRASILWGNAGDQVEEFEASEFPSVLTSERNQIQTTTAKMPASFSEEARSGSFRIGKWTP